MVKVKLRISKITQAQALMGLISPYLTPKTTKNYSQNRDFNILSFQAVSEVGVTQFCK